MKGEFVSGVKSGLPICLGYLSVSFGIGILAVQYGFSPLVASVVSATNLTSAGQAAGLAIMAAGGTLIEMILTQFIINLRYALMGISLSQKLTPSFSAGHRLIASFGITDEIFAVAFSRGTPVTPTYMYGMIAISFIGWVGGTLAGAMAGELLPATIVGAMGITLYGMFLAIIIPVARKKRGVLFVIAIAALFSIIFKYLIPSVSSGFAMIISGVGAAIIGALLFPIKETEGEV